MHAKDGVSFILAPKIVFKLKCDKRVENIEQYTVIVL